MTMFSGSLGGQARTGERHGRSHLGEDPIDASVGDIQLWWGVAGKLTAEKPGWKIMDGSFTMPDGTTPPDMRDRVPIGAGTTYALGATGGSATQAAHATAGLDHTETGPQNHPAHDHSMGNSNITEVATSAGSGKFVITYGSAPSIPLLTDQEAAMAHTATVVDAHPDQTHGTNLPPYAALHFIIRVSL